MDHRAGDGVSVILAIGREKAGCNQPLNPFSTHRQFNQDRAVLATLAVTARALGV
jgi:hypothetical protein